MASAQKELFESIKPWLDEEHCRTCECLQSVLIQIGLDDEENMSVLVAPHKTSHEQMPLAWNVNLALRRKPWWIIDSEVVANTN